jgi:WXG100 family type VII secretion target
MAADGFVSVNFPAMAAAQQELNRHSQDLVRELQDLASALKPLEEMWTGDAQFNYQALKAKIDKGAQGVFADIQMLSQLVGRANEAQQENERALAAKFGG